ncbi:MAG: TIM barrel protein [Bacteroidales bacterium]|nr:TIM barrel protein [Bacteroidales bacterium]
MIKIANAPCSWGALEFDLDGSAPGYVQVLSEMKETGYAGTELGDWGFMPTLAMELRKAVQDYDLQLLGAFVPVALSDPGAHDIGIEKAIKTAGLMYDAGYEDAFIVLADENATVEERTNNAGRITPEMGLPEESWKNFAAGAEKVASAVRKQLGLRTVFHHHCGGYVETPAEVAKLMELTDPSLLGLCLDMGHYAFGGGDPVEALKEYYNRIWHIHFKDYDPVIDKQASRDNFNYFESVEAGIFCELGKGNVDFQSIVNILNKNDYDGWIVVEQDVLPGMGSPKGCAFNNREFIRKLGL